MSGPAVDRGRCLWLLRHGKAASDAPLGGGDRERPLTARGRRDATALGKALATGEGPFGTDGTVPPQLVVCSAAVRTRQTADLLVDASGAPLPVDPRRSLYEADVETALAEIAEIAEMDDDAASALLVGHNPTMYRLALELLAEDGEGSPNRGSGRDALAAREFPTCALAVLFLPFDRWTDVRLGAGRLLGLFTPPY